MAGLRDQRAIARIDVRIRRLSLGSPGDAKLVGGGASELRIDYGPGYRIYYVQRGDAVIILLCGGDKRRQEADIARETTGNGSLKMPLETTLWDPAERLTTPESEFAYLEAAFEDGSPALIAAVIGDIARSRGMAQIARDAGLSRETMDKAFRPHGNPTLETLANVTKALGYRLTITSVTK